MKNKNLEYIEKFFKEYEEAEKIRKIEKEVAEKRAIEKIFILSENFNKLKRWVIKNKIKNKLH